MYCLVRRLQITIVTKAVLIRNEIHIQKGSERMIIYLTNEKKHLSSQLSSSGTVI